MPQTVVRFALFGNEYQARKSDAIEQVLHHLNDRNAEVMVEKKYFDFLKEHFDVPFSASQVFEQQDFEADYAISLGGDGTLLTAASCVAEKQIPIIGINMGRLGFLADIAPEEFPMILDHVYAGKAHIEEHTAIDIQTEGEQISGIPYALNDIAILKRDHASMICINATIDQKLVANYQADGLIVSTPTGSTAYNLSNGGPIIAPDTANLCITPVAPHSLTIRPIVVSDDSEIELSIESRSHTYLVAIDGRSEPLHQTTKIRIRKAPFTIRIVKRDEHQYFDTLRQKLMWGADQRQ